MPYRYIDIERRLFCLGFQRVRQGGSHVLFERDGVLVVVPHHGGKEISLGVEKKIIKSLGLSSESFRGIEKQK